MNKLRFNKKYMFSLFAMFIFPVQAEWNTVSGFWIGKEVCLDAITERNLIFIIDNDNVVIRKVIDNRILDEEILGTTSLINKHGTKQLRIRIRLEWTLGDITYEGYISGNAANIGVQSLTINGQNQTSRQTRRCFITFRKISPNEFQSLRR